MLSLEELREVRSKRRLTQEEKLAYREHWRSSKQSQRLFCAQEGLSLATFNGWLKSLSCQAVKGSDETCLIAVGVESQSVKQADRLGLRFTLPNGLMIAGEFSLAEVSCFIKELSHGLSSLR